MKKIVYPPDLFQILDVYADDDLSDETALRLLTDAVAFYNIKNSTNFDPEKAVDAWYSARETF